MSHLRKKLFVFDQAEKKIVVGRRTIIWLGIKPIPPPPPGIERNRLKISHVITNNCCYQN